MRLAICASALRDEDKITHIAEMLQEIDISHYSRDTLLLLWSENLQMTDREKYW